MGRQGWYVVAWPGLQVAAAGKLDYAEHIPDTPLLDQLKHLVRKIHRPTVTVNGVPTDYQPTEFQYDSHGNLQKIIDAAGEETTFTRDLTGQVLTVTDRRGKTTTFTYNTGTRNLETIITPSGPGAAPSRTTTLTTDAFDNVTEVEDNAGNLWEYAFDALNRLTDVTDARGKITQFSFANGLLDEVIAPANNGSSTSPRTTSYTYDTAGRVTQIDSDISASAQQARVAFEYTGFSEIFKLKRLMNSSWKATEYEYDPLGRQTSVKDPLNRVSTMEYAPFCTEFTSTSARGVTRTSSFDTLCRMTMVETNGEDQEMHYDELGRLIKIVQTEKARYGKKDVQPPWGPRRFGSACYREHVEERLFEYDSLDRLTKVTFPDGEEMLYEYDEEGNVTKVTDTNEAVTEYSYYNDGRLYEVTIKRTSEADRVFTYAYDAAGRLETITYPDETGTTSPIEARFYGTGGASTEPGWDENGNLLRLFYHRDGSRIHSFEYTYDDSGNRITMVDTPANTANAVAWKYNYDWLDRLVQVEKGANLGSTSVVRLYGYDESDNRISVDMQDLMTPELHTFAYDNADQLSSRSVTIGMGSPALVESFSHDNDGNMIARVLDPSGTPATTNYFWDDFDRLTAVEKPDGTTVNVYDSGNLRKKKVRDDGVKLKSFYSGLPTVSEVDGSDAFSYLMGHQLMGFQKGSDYYYFLTDGLSSVRAMVKASNGATSNFLHDEWGVKDPSSDSDSPKTYVGGLGVHDDTADTGLLYMRQRHYDPTLARFLSRDPIGFAGGLNLYGYVGGNPLSRSDPEGLRFRLVGASRAQKEAFTAMLTDFTGLEATVDDGGFLNVKGKANDALGTLLKGENDPKKAQGAIDLSFVEDSEVWYGAAKGLKTPAGRTIGDTNTHRLDLADFQATRGSSSEYGPSFAYAALFHELYEATLIGRCTSSDAQARYNTYHELAKDAEDLLFRLRTGLTLEGERPGLVPRSIVRVYSDAKGSEVEAIYRMGSQPFAPQF